MSLDDLRRAIDGIDDQILALLERRAEIARDVAQAKQASHDPADPHSLGHGGDDQRSIVDGFVLVRCAQLGERRRLRAVDDGLETRRDRNRVPIRLLHTQL